MGNLIQLVDKKGAVAFKIRREALALMEQLFNETGQFPEPPPLETVAFPVFPMEILKTLVGGGLMLEPDFCEKYPLHFALITLGIVYQRATKAMITKVAESLGKDPDDIKKAEVMQRIANIHNSPMFHAGNSIVNYTMNTMMMRHFSPETYIGERLILILNSLTDKVELWAGHPLPTGQQTADTPEASSENPGSAPVA